MLHFQLFAAGQGFSAGTPVFSTNETDRHDISEILLKVALITITLTPLPMFCSYLSKHHSDKVSYTHIDRADCRKNRHTRG